MRPSKPPTTRCAILFDFDGTLAPNLDLPDMRRQVIDLTQQAGVPEQVFADRYIVEIIDAASAWLGASGDDYARRAHNLITDIEMRAAEGTQLLPGVTELLAQLRREGWHLGVVTRNCRAAVLAVEPLLPQFVDAIYARDDVEHLKPDTRHLRDALQSLNVQPQDATMIGDGALDMQAGRALGLHCIGVLTGSSTHERLVQAGAHEVLPDVTHMRDAAGKSTS